MKVKFICIEIANIDQRNNRFPLWNAGAYRAAMSRLNLTVQPDGIAVVTLAHPPLNVMDAPLLEELTGLFEGLAAEAGVRAAVITGEGRAFSAGLDLKLVPTLDRLGQRRLVDALNDCFGTLYAWPKPLG